MTKIMSVELTITKGRTRVNFIDGLVHNEETNKNQTFKELGAKSGKELYIDKVRALFIFADVDFHITFAGAEVEFDMMSFYKIIRPIEIEEMTLELDNTFVPNAQRVLIVASDYEWFDFGVAGGRPHLYYGNNLTANNAGGSGSGSDSDYQVILFKHTILDTLKIKVFNDQVGQNNIWVDIQHRELPESDTDDKWVSYANYPKQLNAGLIEEFGDDALRDKRHHFNRVRVKTVTQGQTSPVKASLYGV